MAVSSPAAGRITRGFGRQPDGSFHYGTDRGWASGITVTPMLPGTVVSTSFLTDYGQTIRIRHGNDTQGRLIESRYCHLATTAVTVGQEVTTGQNIGTMGSTGTLAKARHLHTELWVDGTRVDETKFEFTMPTTNQPVNGSNMTTLYSKGGTTPTLFALAGDSPGTPANWLETTATALANQWAAQVGASAASLTAAQFDAWKADYLAPLAVSGGGSGSGLTTAEHNQLFALPTKPELAAVLTTQTGDINTHTTEAVNGITLTSAP